MTSLYIIHGYDNGKCVILYSKNQIFAFVSNKVYFLLFVKCVLFLPILPYISVVFIKPNFCNGNIPKEEQFQN